MSHYEMNYSNPDASVNRKKALEDIRDFWGAKKFDSLFDLFSDFFCKWIKIGKTKQECEQTCMFYCDFGGVLGYPAEVLWEEILQEIEQNRFGSSCGAD